MNDFKIGMIENKINYHFFILVLESETDPINMAVAENLNYDGEPLGSYTILIQSNHGTNVTKLFENAEDEWEAQYPAFLPEGALSQIVNAIKKRQVGLPVE